VGLLGAAFAAGLISFLSPCVLPLIPVYLAYLTGASFDELRSKTPRHLVMLHASLFIVGFSFVFIATGATASLLGQALNDYRGLIERVGGVVLIILGLWMAGAFKVGFLMKEARFHFSEKPAGKFGSVIVGAAFAAGWTPCVGPILGFIYSQAALSGSVQKGVLLLSVYSAGFAIPLLLCAFAVERSIKVLNKIKPWLGVIEKTTGTLLVLLGLFMATGLFSKYSTLPLSLFPGWAKMFGQLDLSLRP
jgi:cytochrome c-type biogenesis protein